MKVIAQPNGKALVVIEELRIVSCVSDTEALW